MKILFEFGKGFCGSGMFGKDVGGRDAVTKLPRMDSQRSQTPRCRILNCDGNTSDIEGLQ